MTFDPTKVIWATAITVYNPASAAEEILYFATKKSFTVGGGAPTAFRSLLQQPAVAARSAFADRSTHGRGVVGAGNVVLDGRIATNGPLDVYQQCHFDGRPIVIYVGQEGADFPSGFTVVLDGTMETARFGQEEVTIELRDWQRAAETPIQSTVFAGSGGLEGGSDLAGKPKPVLLGKVRNFAPILVNAAKQIYQFHDGAISTVDAVYDRGLPLGTSPASWTARTSNIGANTIYALGYGNSLYVAAGAAGKLSTSPDATTWTARTSGFGADTIYGVAYGAGLWVAVGLNGKLYSSPDGITWTSRTSGFGASTIYAVTYANGLFVAVGASSKISTSTDGITWTARTFTPSVGTPSLFAVAYGNGVYVVGGASAVLGTSTDGITWTDRSAVAGIAFAQMNALTFGSDQFVAAGEGSAYGIATSFDGITWTARGVDIFLSNVGKPSSLVFGNGLYLMVTNFGPASVNTVAISPDGVTWTALSAYSAIGVNNPVVGLFGDNLFVMAGDSGMLVTSAPSAAYANSTDLQDDTLAPSPGTYKYLSSAGGSYIRLATVPTKLTMAATQGAAAGNRTAAQLAVVVLGRAGFIAGDWSASDVTTLDTKNSAVLGDYITEPGVTCADVLDRLLPSVGAWWAPDRTGVIRMQRLEDPAPNLISSPQALAAAPWANGGGTTTATNGVGVYAGRSFSRIANVTGGNWIQQWTPPASGTYWFTFYVKRDSVNGTVVQLLQDVTSGLTKAQVIWTIAADGTLTASVPIGTQQRTVLVPGNEGVYGVTVKATGIVFGNNNTFYASTNSGATATSFLMSDVLITPNDPDVTIDQAQMDGMAEVASGDENGGIPSSRTVVRYARNFAPLSGADLAGRVSASTRALFQKEWLDTATAVDTAIETAHLLATTKSYDTCFAETADAQTERTRLQALFGVDRKWFEVPVLLTDTLAAVDLGHVAELVSTRYLCNAGKRFRVLGVRPDAGDGRIILSVWG